MKLDRPLPFRVALMPIEVKSDDNLSAATPASYSEDKKSPSLAFTSEELTTVLLSRLQKEGFTDVIALAPKSDAPIEANVADTLPSERFEDWMEEAQRQQADLLLRVTLVYEPSIAGAINEKFWLNLPLFLLGGPFCYFINDRSYTTRATLSAEFFSVKARKRKDKANEDLAQLLRIPILAEYDGSQLDFTDRAGKNLGAYALSLLVPAGLLMRSGERVLERVHDKALEDLSSALMEEIASKKDLINSNPNLAQFELDLATSGARRVGGKVRLLAQVKVLGEGSLKQYRVRSGSMEPMTFDLSKDEARELRPISCDVPTDQAFVQLEIEDGKNLTRSYTFRVEAGS